MSSIDQAVSDYWTGAAHRFDGAASHIRHGDIWRDVFQVAFGPGGSRDVVDFGTGTGACAIIAAELGHRVTGVDGSAGMLATARAAARARGVEVSWIEAQIYEAGLAEGGFDIAIFRNVLWTVADPAAALDLAARILRPGGRVIVSDGLWERSSNRSDYDPAVAARLPMHRGLEEAEARALLGKAGFGTIENRTHLFAENPYETMGSPPFFLVSAIKPRNGAKA